MFSYLGDWPWATLAAVASAGFAGTQIALTRRQTARRSGSGLSGQYYEQAKTIPDDFQPDEPGPWSDAQLVLRIDNVLNEPFVSVIALLQLADGRTFRAFADWVPPNSVMYCLVGDTDEHDFISLRRSSVVEMTYVDSSGKVWHRTSTGRLTSGFHPLVRIAWGAYSRFPRLAKWWPRKFSPRMINGKFNLAASFRGVGDLYSDDPPYSGESWHVFEASQRTVEEDLASIPQIQYEPTESEWRDWGPDGKCRTS